jgi:hypothetical protein
MWTSSSLLLQLTQSGCQTHVLHTQHADCSTERRENENGYAHELERRGVMLAGLMVFPCA